MNTRFVCTTENTYCLWLCFCHPQLLVFKRQQRKLFLNAAPEVHAVRTHAAAVFGSHAVHISDVHTESLLSRLNQAVNVIKERQELESHDLEKIIT